MSGQETPRFTVDRDPQLHAAGSWAVRDARRNNDVMIGRIPTQAIAANIVTAMNWHWRWVLTAGEEHAETNAGAVNPALAELIRAARDTFASFGKDEPFIRGQAERLERLGDALAPFDNLEIC